MVRTLAAILCNMIPKEQLQIMATLLFNERVTNSNYNLLTSINNLSLTVMISYHSDDVFPFSISYSLIF